MIYLATPYSHPDESVREQRYQDACRLTAALIKRGYCVFSPIVHSHPLVKCGLPNTHKFWMPRGREYFNLCSTLWVAKFDGWDVSKGVGVEIDWAVTSKKPIEFIDPSDWLK